MKWLLSILLVGVCFQMYAQSKAEIIQERIEFLAQEMEVEDISMEDIFEVLNDYYDHPLNLNTATQEEMQSLMLLNDFQIKSLLKWRDEKGLFKTLYELTEIDYWDLLTLEQIMPFVRVSEVKEKQKRNFKEYLKEGKIEGYMRYIQNIERKDGYQRVSDEEKEASNKYYWGDPSKIYSRFRYTHKKDLSVGVTMEKDPGEQLFGKTQPYGFDFYSAHAYYGGGKIIRKSVLGDYQLQIGQGLAFWTGYGFSKTADASTVKKNAGGIKPYNSTDEARFLRGAGLELGYRNFSFTSFVSYKGVDGSIQSLDTLENEEARLASSINQSGYHRTTSELARKNSMHELIYGAVAKYQTRVFHIGLNAIQQSYNTYFKREESLINKYQFEGKNLLNLSADYSVIIRNLSLFGEVAMSADTRKLAVLQGMDLAVGRGITLSALYRNYPKDYHTFYSTGFGDGSSTINESGFYFGGTFKLHKAWILNAYMDLFSSPWLKYRVDGPSKGNEVFAQLKYKPNTRFETYLRVRQKNKMQNASEYVGNIRPIETYRQMKYQWGLSVKLSGGWWWKSRIDFVTDNRPSKGLQKGFALSQDILYRPNKLPIEISLRYAIFSTDSYDTRIYAYEYNLQNVFSIPTYYGKGSRAYILLRYSFFKDHFDVWLRYAVFVYDGPGYISSGSEKINGNVKSEFGAQLRFKF